MLSLQEFKALSNVAKSDYLRDNFPVNAKSLAARKPLHGAGINDADYLTTPIIDGQIITCPAYRAWQNMIGRSYCSRVKSRFPTYTGVTVCDEWHSFVVFRKWWILNQVDGRHLDKDILNDSRKYGPDSCLFVPKWLNNFISDSGASRGDLPIGVIWRKDCKKFQSLCSHPFKRQKSLGMFSSANSAHAAWLACKHEIAKELKPLMDEIDARIYPRIIEIIDRENYRSSPRSAKNPYIA